ncbi:DUF4250 domain-containing protein [Suipraeoptans intestinalis]|uniref:DUF4250 domain-containing protein n=1 Tax=Suipraeoptans intestinalis TaxID=2606628 RepID=A0A6N7UZ55_9FIRM|nr:DUF4250 domain-containing protein [Suipraeoptans intestinalis]MDD7769989.1 DUF4250 domain-containing protein [Suipraeoptans intestinalis]MDY3122094.1 DUF4250 domain-containing protein [Suipraeoptans intestinalis]MSR92856.1 DUF4250 domain-containing protein [Suipraeoptans intestinalis]
MKELPKDPHMLVSVINTKIRDQYHDLDAFCEEMGVERKELSDYLKVYEYEYDESTGRFY